MHIAPCRAQVTGKETASLFLAHVFRHHGLPESIVSDRDPRFTSAFWRHLFAKLGTKLAMSTADHPQTDGQTERVNRSVEDILRSVCAEHPTEWSSMLPFVEFAINNSVHASTGETPFFLNGLRHPRTPVSFVSASASNLSGGGHLAMLDASEEALLEADAASDMPKSCTSDVSLNIVTRSLAQRNPDHDEHVTEVGDTKSVSAKDTKAVAEAQSFIDARAAVIRKVRDAMAKAQEKQKEYADQHGRKNTEQFHKGDTVLLSRHNLPKEAITCIPDGASKMHPRFFGPYKVVEKISDVNYRIDLPTKMKPHPVFYVGRLRRYVDPIKATYPAPKRLELTTTSSEQSLESLVRRAKSPKITSSQRKTTAVVGPSSQGPPHTTSQSHASIPLWTVVIYWSLLW